MLPGCARGVTLRARTRRRRDGARIRANRRPDPWAALVDTFRALEHSGTTLRTRQAVRPIRSSHHLAAPSAVRRGSGRRLLVRRVHGGLQHRRAVGDRPGHRAPFRSRRRGDLDGRRRLRADHRDRDPSRHRCRDPAVLRRVDPVADRRVADERGHRALPRTTGQLAPPSERRPTRRRVPVSTSTRPSG